MEFQILYFSIRKIFAFRASIWAKLEAKGRQIQIDRSGPTNRGLFNTDRHENENESVPFFGPKQRSAPYTKLEIVSILQ